jgi:hypothetical protein
MTPDEEAKIDWNLTTWKGSRLQQHREFFALSFREKLENIEQLDELAYHFQEQRKRKGRPYISVEPGERAAGAAVHEDPPASNEQPDKGKETSEP